MHTISSALPLEPPPPTRRSAPASDTRPLDLVSLNGQPLARSEAGGELPGLVTEVFSPAEWATLNPGHYHDRMHPVHVAETVADVASHLGRSSERVEFLQKVALLHDLDERIGQPSTVSPARVPVTLDWLDHNEEALNQRLGWQHADFQEAKTLIARTDFPFQGAAVERYQALLEELPAERRQPTMDDGLLLRFADQTGNYTVDSEQSRRYVHGLADELKLDYATLAKGSPAFLATAGTDLQDDWKIAGALHLNALEFASRETLLGALSPQRQEALKHGL